MTSKVVMVTGSSGLVGTGIKSVIEEEGLKEGIKWVFLTSKDANLTVQDEVKALFEKHRPTHVLHLAAKVGGLYANMKYPAEFLYCNSTMNTNVVHCCYLYKVEKLISCLSTCIFPDQIKMPMTEEDIHSGPPHFSNAAYAYSKRMLDVMSKAYNQQYGTKFMTITPVNIFGENDQYSLESSHVAPGLMHRMLIAKNSGDTTFTCYGSGKPLRQFIYSKDLARVFIWALFDYDGTESLIACDHNTEISISDLVHKVAKCIDYKGEIVFDTSKADGQFKKTCSNEKLLGLNPNLKFTPFDTALKSAVDWFIQNYETCRK